MKTVREVIGWAIMVRKMTGQPEPEVADSILSALKEAGYAIVPVELLERCANDMEMAERYEADCLPDNTIIAEIRASLTTGEGIDKMPEQTEPIYKDVEPLPWAGILVVIVIMTVLAFAVGTFL